MNGKKGIGRIMTDLSGHIHHLLGKGDPVVLATVIRHVGSTPRGAGAKMIVCEGGTIIGTIGGGAVEAEVIRSAPDIFRSGGAIIRHFNFSSTDVASSMGMICGGKMDVLMERLDPAEKAMAIFSALASTIRTGEKCLLGRTFHPEHSSPRHHHLFLLAGQDAVFGNAPFDTAGLEELKETAFQCRAPVIRTAGDLTVIADPFFFAECVYLFGAGHVAQQVARILNMVDFRTVVIDDRKEFANRDLFPTVDDICVPASFETVFSELLIDRNGIIVILTRGHAHDQTVLEQALKTEAGYIGMIGSRRKRNTIYDNLSKKGVHPDALARVHSPIGLEIGAQTPEEIAVSITAELIAYRAGAKI
jgi:xanthine dehydrogenase accessory factor